MPGLNAVQRSRFDRGAEFFAHVFTPATGLGPLYNATSCAGCHRGEALGGSGGEGHFEVSALLAEGGYEPLVAEGGPVLQRRLVPALAAETLLEEEPAPERGEIAWRSAPSLAGLGLLEAIPDGVLLDLADPDDLNGDGISGRVHTLVDGRIGRFGRKAFVATLAEYVAWSFSEDLGITVPTHPVEVRLRDEPFSDELDPVADPELGGSEVLLVESYLRYLAPTPPLERTREARWGAELFEVLGCAACHVPQLMTGNHREATFAYRKVHAFTDLLLHDMGEELADLGQGEAGPREFRTEPLAGLRLRRTFLHDARTTSLEEAVLLHGGEADGARRAFRDLGPEERGAVLEFLGSL